MIAWRWNGAKRQLQRRRPTHEMGSAGPASFMEDATMPAYVIVNIDVIDPVRYEEYKRAAGPTVTAFGGRFIARGGSAEVLEGGWTPRRVVILEFPSLARAKEWWGSPEYAGPKRLRQETATTEMIVVEGV
jgi:uncharacterized protein (DUF1330 family)